MGELIDRLKARPRLAVQLISASFLCNLLALASPLFVMQVLNRYVAHGVDSTLVTLTAGTTVAVILEFMFRQLRHGMAKELNDQANEEVNLASYAVLVHGKVDALGAIQEGKRREIVNGATDVESTYNASNTNTLLDLPFSIIFITILFLLSPVLAIVSTAIIGLIFIYGVKGAAAVRDVTNELRSVSGQTGGLLETAIREMDTVHAFNNAAFVKKEWYKISKTAGNLRARIAEKQGLIQAVTQSGTALMSIVVITVGALLVVGGHMDVGAMIGANILATRALQPTSKFAQMGPAFTKAEEALAQLKEFVRLKLEADSGSAKRDYSGRIEFKDVAFFYPGAPAPLFESLSMKIEPGNVIIVVGNTGTGKTTFARLMAGLVDPVRGQILVDGMDLRQVAPEWWRKQICYLPQEPTFLNATILENFQAANPDVEMGVINKSIDDAGLRQFIAESPDGLETPIVDNGRHLPVGTRRRLALARALITGGRLVLIDEMLDGFDQEGRAAINSVAERLVKEGKTLIITSHTASSKRRISAALDLNIKPEPRVTYFSENYQPSDIVKQEEG